MFIKHVFIKNVFQPDQYFSFPVTEKDFLSLKQTHLFRFIIVMSNHTMKASSVLHIHAII